MFIAALFHFVGWRKSVSSHYTFIITNDLTTVVMWTKTGAVAASSKLFSFRSEYAAHNILHSQRKCLGNGRLFRSLFLCHRVSSLDPRQALYSVLALAYNRFTRHYDRGMWSCYGLYSLTNPALGVEAPARGCRSLYRNLYCAIRCRPTRAFGQNSSAQSDLDARPRARMHPCVYPSDRQRLGSRSTR
jgi:hypothetical protein